MNEITMIPVGLLEHHPENPRKDLGDLTELTESIKKNGIMQNLTVIADPETSKYLVVIGNRRLEAAKAAGLIELPCVVKDLDHKTQIATMLEENMQRQDLTVYEQAQGFQMMMDLGYTAKEIGEKTGFSEKTVKDRIKFTKFNQKHFEKAVQQGATLMDMIEISKLESKSDQNDVLKAAGTNNFRQILMRALTEQEYKHGCEYLGKIAQKAGAEELPEGTDSWSDCNRHGRYCNEKDKEEKILKEIKKLQKEHEGKQLYYRFAKDWSDGKAVFEFFTMKEKNENGLTPEQEAAKELDRQVQRRKRKVKQLWAEAYRLRTDFIRNYTVTNGFGMTTIAKLIVKYSLRQNNSWNHQLPEYHHWREKYIKECLDIKQEEYEEKKSIYELIEERGIPQIRATIAWVMGGGVFDSDSSEYGLFNYDGRYCEDANGQIKERYEFLQEIGYQMSDMEKQLLDGTHECYKG